MLFEIMANSKVKNRSEKYCHDKGIEFKQTAKPWIVELLIYQCPIIYPHY